MPAVDPVTKAVFPERSIFMGHLHHRLSMEILGVTAATAIGERNTAAIPPLSQTKSRSPRAPLPNANLERLRPRWLPPPRPGRNPGPWHWRRDRRTRAPPSAHGDDSGSPH